VWTAQLYNIFPHFLINGTICEKKKVLNPKRVVCFLLGNSPGVWILYADGSEHCLFHLHRRIGELFTYLPMKMEQTECSETSAYKIQTSGNYPKENIQHTEHGESLKSRTRNMFWDFFRTFVWNISHSKKKCEKYD